MIITIIVMVNRENKSSLYHHHHHHHHHHQTDTLSGEYTHSRTPAFTLRFSHRGSTANLHSHTEGEGKLILIVSHRKEGTFIPTFLNRCENTLIHGHTKSARQNSHSPSQGTQSGGRTRTLFHTHGVEGSRSHSFTLSLFHHGLKGTHYHSITDMEMGTLTLLSSPSLSEVFRRSLSP